MGKQRNFLIGRRFGRLVVLAQLPHKGDYASRWLCQCDCGTEKEIRGKSLLRGDTQSCGCLHKEEISKTHKTHGMRHSTEYNIWATMFSRCENPRCKEFRYYGARGIKICDRWRESFENFYADMGKRPIGMSIDRVNNDGPYSPENCRWADRVTQARNNRKAIIITIEEQSLPVSEWTKIWGIDPSYIFQVAKRRCMSSADVIRLIAARRISDAYHGLPPRSSNRGWL